MEHPRYRADIDGLRALAVLMVVAYHAFPGWIQGGFIGVDVFFVISGYLISTIILEGLRRRNFSFAEFYARRILRIFPALILVLSAIYVVGWFVLFVDEYRQLGKHVAAGAGFVSNIVLWRELGYFDSAAETKPLLHLWSLGVEEQFYMAWPLLLWLTWLRGGKSLLITLLLTGMSFLLSVKGVSGDLAGSFYLPQTRFWELMCGSVLAWMALDKKMDKASRAKLDTLLGVVTGGDLLNRGRRNISNALSIGGLLFLGYGLSKINKNVGFPGVPALMPVLGAMLIISAGPEAWVNRVFLSSRLLVWVGLISYPLYLWHWPLLSLARIIEGEAPSVGVCVLLISLSVVLAWLTYKYVERPIRSAECFQRKTIALGLIMVVLGYVGYSTYAREGFAFRWSLAKASIHEELYGDYPHEPFRNAACTTSYPQFNNFQACLISKSSPPEVLIVGDSHSNHYYKSLANRLPKNSVMNVAAWGCLPFSFAASISGSECERKTSEIIRFITESGSIKTVYLAGYWSYLIAGEFEIQNENYRSVGALRAGRGEGFVDAGKRFVGALARSGKKIVLIKDVPDMNFNIRSCFDIPPLDLMGRGRSGICGVDRREYESRDAAYSSLLAMVTGSSPSLGEYNPRALFCDNEVCRATDAGMPLYFSSDHLTIYGADLVVGDLLLKNPVGP